MWCTACQQDVPGVARSASDSAVSCARCGQSLAMPPVNSSHGTGTSDDGPRSAPDSEMDELPLPEFMELEDWDFEEVLSEADRIVRSARRQRAMWEKEAGVSLRVEPAHRLGPASGRRKRESTGEIAKPAARTNSVSWAVVSLGLAVFVCGAILVGIAVVQGRTDLWQIGLPMVLGGQVAVIAVVIGQLEAVWQSNKATFLALHAMEERIGSWQKSSEVDRREGAEPKRENRPHFRDTRRRASSHEF